MTDTSRNQKPMSETPERSNTNFVVRSDRFGREDDSSLACTRSCCVTRFFLFLPARGQQRSIVAAPQHHRSDGVRWTIWGLSLVAAVLVIFGQRRLRSGNVLDWQVAGWVGVACGLVALAPDMGVHGSAVLSRIEWLRVNLHWLVSDQHRNLGWRHVLARDDARSIASDEARVRNSESRVVERGHREVVSSERSVDDYFWGFVAVSGALFLAMFYLRNAVQSDFLVLVKT